MALGQVLIFADQDDGICPKILTVATRLVGIMRPEAFPNSLGFPNIGHLTIRLAFILADENVDPRTLDFGKRLADFTKLVSAKRNSLNR